MTPGCMHTLLVVPAVVAAAYITLAAPSAAHAGCGDGILEEGSEECDWGELNSDTAPNACRSECLLPACGDSVVDTGEACDEGWRNSDEIPNRCRTTCQFPRCGDGLIDASFGELCDDDNDDAGDGCDRECILERGWSCYGQPSFCSTCGNGEIDGLEQCDDGDRNSDTAPDACRRDCTYPICGDGVTDSSEECDDGDANSNWVPDACRTDCELPRCGDDVHDPGYDEECDLGDENSDDAGSRCTTLCAFPACGDGAVQFGEMCEPALDPDCTDACRPNVCGDGVLSEVVDEEGMALEVCDDGNNRDGDDCRYDCRQDLTLCGNLRLDPGEECDDGRSNSRLPDACRPDCRLASCGDGVVDTGEECDRTPGCESSCSWALR